MWYETDRKEFVLSKLLCLDASGTVYMYADTNIDILVPNILPLHLTLQINMVFLNYRKTSPTTSKEMPRIGRGPGMEPSSLEG